MSGGRTCKHHHHASTTATGVWFGGQAREQSPKQAKKGQPTCNPFRRGAVSALVGWCRSGWVVVCKQVLAAGVTWVEHPWRDRCHASTAATGVWFGGASEGANTISSAAAFFATGLGLI